MPAGRPYPRGVRELRVHGAGPASPLMLCVQKALRFPAERSENRDPAQFREIADRFAPGSRLFVAPLARPGRDSKRTFWTQYR